MARVGHSGLSGVDSDAEQESALKAPRGDRQALYGAAHEAALRRSWGRRGYHGIEVSEGRWSAISDAGEPFFGRTACELDAAIRAHWEARQ